jgi:hypothetical protein
MRHEQLDRDSVLDDAAVKAVFPAPFADLHPLVEAVFRLRSRPRACGVMRMNDFRDQDGVDYVAFGVEVPRTGKDRVVCFANKGEGFVLVDTFLIAQSAFIRTFAVSGTSITYYDVRGNELLQRPASAA